MAISPINLGSFYTNTNGTSVASGLSSGLNTDSLIKALTAAQDSQITGLEDQVTVNNTQIGSLTSLSQVLTALQTSIAPISNPSSLDTTNNLFAVRSSSITSNTTQAASNYMTANVASGTASGTYVISNITQLATKATQETGAFTLDSVDDTVVAATPTDGLFSAGVIGIRDKDGNIQDVTIIAGDSLSDIAQSFNAVSTATGISASVLQTSAGQYKLIFTSTTTGEAADFDLTDPLVVVSDDDGALAGIHFHKNTDAQDAKFKLNNVDIQRSSNNINDLVSGVTINLLQDTVATPGARFTLQIAPDTANIATGISNFATAYNNFMYFYSQQTQLDSTTGAPAKTAVLYSDSTLRNIYNTVSGIAASLVKGLGNGQPSTLASIGITFTDFAGNSTTPATSNILSVDNSILQSVLSTNFTGVENVLGDSFSSSSPNLAMYRSPTSATVSNFTLDVLNSGHPPTYTAKYTDTNNTVQTVQLTGAAVNGGGIALTGPEGSVFAGMTLLYTGVGDETGITSTIPRGLLSTIQKQLKAALQSTTGLVGQDQKSLTEKNATLQKQITTVTDQTAALRQSLLQKYSQLEAAIAKANSVLNLLNAQQIANSAL